MGRSSTYYNLLEAFQEDGCPVCRVTLDAVDRHLENIEYESLTDTNLRRRISSAYGFCDRHIGRWLQAPRLLGTATIYRDVIARLSEDLGQLRFEQHDFFSRLESRLRGGKSRDPLVPEADCLICGIQADEERKAVGTLVDALDDWEFEDKYAASEGLCLAHLRAALREAPDDARFDALRQAALARQQLLRYQLEEVIRRHEHRYASEPVGEERGADRRAVRHVAGEAVQPRPAYRARNWTPGAPATRRCRQADQSGRRPPSPPRPDPGWEPV